MDQLVTTIGALRLRLCHVSKETTLPSFASRPFLLLDDGTEVAAVEWAGERYLFVDYRSDFSAPARVEFWERLGPAPEYDVAGLLAVCEAATEKMM